MLKRNGQLCHRTVPNYTGRLTDFEFLAYNAAVSQVEEDSKQLSAVTDSLTDVERAFPRLIEASEGASNSFNEVIADETGTQWSVVKPLLKLRRTELLFCKRFTEGEPEFAVIQKLNPDSMFAKAKGVCQLQMTGNDARLLLEDFVDGERQTLQLYAQDMVAAAREVIEQKCPDQNLSRVVKAIAQRFAKKISTEEQVAPVQAVRRRTEGVRV